MTGCFRTRPSRHSGASLIAAIFLLLLFAALAAYMLWFSSIQQRSSAMDVTGARALQAARTGVDWGMYRLLRDHACVASESFPLATGGTLAEFSVTVSCVKTADTDQLGAAIKLYLIRATACNAPACPAVVPGESYSERVLEVLLPCSSCP